MLRQYVGIEQRCVGKAGHVANAWHVRDDCATPDIDEDPVSLKLVLADAHGPLSLESRVAHQQSAARHPTQPIFIAGTTGLGDLARSCMDTGHVDPHVPGDDAVIRPAACEMRGVGAGHQRLGWCAAGIDAGASDQMPFDDGHRRPCRGQPCRHRRPGLAGADNDCVKASGHGVPSYN